MNGRSGRLNAPRCATDPAPRKFFSRAARRRETPRPRNRLRVTGVRKPQIPPHTKRRMARQISPSPVAFPLFAAANDAAGADARGRGEKNSTRACPRPAPVHAYSDRHGTLHRTQPPDRRHGRPYDLPRLWRAAIHAVSGRPAGCGSRRWRSCGAAGFPAGLGWAERAERGDSCAVPRWIAFPGRRMCPLLAFSLRRDAQHLRRPVGAGARRETAGPGSET